MGMILLFFVQIIHKEREEDVMNESQNILNILSDNISTNLQRYTELSRLVMTDSRVVSFLRADTSDIDIGLIRTAKYGAMGVLNVTNMVDSVYIFRNDLMFASNTRNNTVAYFKKIQTEEWMSVINDLKGSAVIMINGNDAVFRADKIPLITIARAIYDVDSQEKTGMLLMNFTTSMLEPPLEKLNNSDIFIIGTDGTFLAGNEDYKEYYDESFNSEEVVHKIIMVDNEEMLVSGQKIPEIPMIMVSVSSIRKGIVPQQTFVMMGFISATLILATAVMSIFVYYNITKPVSDITSSIESNREKGLLEKINVKVPNNDISLITDSYNNVVEYTNDLIKKLIEKEKTVQKVEMHVLQEQIKPHFLYNSLETIGFLAVDAGAEDVYSALETLGSFYRNFLSKGDRDIPLKREIAIVQDYLKLQKLRYGDIIRDEYDIAPDTENFIIPKLILQPLVENSIYHGIRLKGEEGIIKITSRFVDNDLHLTVRDTGIGMSQEDIDKALAIRKAESSEDPASSFGLWGTIERIRVFCDKEDVVKIRSEIGEYTEVEFIIPQKIFGRHGS